MNNSSLTDKKACRKDYLLGLLPQIEEQLNALPIGRLRIKGDATHPRYYLCRPDLPPSGRYLGRKDFSIANMLAQRDYLEKLKSAISYELTFPYRQNTPQHPRPEDVFDSLNPYRQSLVTPLLLSDDAYAKEWQAFTYPPKGFPEDYPNYHTKRGERVRSKSEILIADLLGDLHIPYRYEAPLTMIGGDVIHPDFTILLPSRKICYYEHCGKMDDALYLQHFMQRKSLYIRSGLIPGRDVFYTFESASSPVDMKELRRMFKVLFL